MSKMGFFFCFFASFFLLYKLVTRLKYHRQRFQDEILKSSLNFLSVKTVCWLFTCSEEHFTIKHVLYVFKHYVSFLTARKQKEYFYNFAGHAKNLSGYRSINLALMDIIKNSTGRNLAKSAGSINSDYTTCSICTFLHS